MRYLALFAMVAVAYAAELELQPIVLPAPAQPFIEAPEFKVQVVDSAFKAKIPVPEDLMKKVLEATNYVYRESESEAVKVATLDLEAPIAAAVERVQVVDAPIAAAVERVQVVDAPVEAAVERVQVVDAPIAAAVERVQVVDAPIAAAVERVQVVDAPVEAAVDRVQVVDAPVEATKVESPYERVQVVNEVVLTPVERVRVVNAPAEELCPPLQGRVNYQPTPVRLPGKVYPNPMLRGNH